MSGLREELATWRRDMIRSTGLAPATVDRYVGDADRFVAWLEGQDADATAADVTAQDAREYRAHLLRAKRAPATINRALISLALFLDAAGRADDNPFRKVDRIDVVAGAPRALAHADWMAVRRSAARATTRDHGLALALVCLLRFAGPRVGEVAALCLPDVRISSRRGTLVIRQGKGLKHREVPLVLEAREPLQDYLTHRRALADRWTRTARVDGEPAPAWAAWPDGRLFLGQRGPLTERGIRQIVAKLGHAAKIDTPLSPHDLRHTFATALLDPTAYGVERSPLPLTAVQDLLGHADPATTARYTRATPAALARLMGEPDELS